MQSPLPTVGIASLTFNDEAILEDCLRSIREQNYPQDRISILLMDGGSQDGTAEIARRHGADFVSRPDLRDSAHRRVELMMSSLKTDVIVFFSADCRFHERDCLRNMIEVLSRPDIAGVQTQRYAIRPRDPALSRYLSLIGGVDPIAVGLRKADRTPYDVSGWHSYGESQDEGSYYRVTFSDDIARLPAIGANGFAIRREYLEEAGGMKNGGHADMCARLIRKGRRSFAFLKYNHIVHYIDIPVWAFIKRRLSWARLYAADSIARDYSVMTTKDVPRLVWVILSYSTLIVPLLRAVAGYLRKKDAAWFLHPVVCFAFFLSYSMLYGSKLIPLNGSRNRSKSA